MSYQVFARKWRPQRFADLVGQGHVVKALINALDHDRLHHAFLFSGTRGVGKTTIARILAKSLNCETGVSSQPCGKCSACQEVDTGRFVDLIEVDAASRTKVDDTRELLDNVQYAPTRGRYKVYLIDEVHMLSGHSFNALLKTLEEPPPHVKFLLATTDPQKLPVTVLSRCLQFNLKRLQPEQISAQLEKILQAEVIQFEPACLKLLARSADGSLRDALSLLDQAIAYGGGKLQETDVREMLGSIDHALIDRLLQALAAADAAQLLAVVAEASEHNMDSDVLLQELLLALHHIALAQRAPQVIDTLGDDADKLRHYAGALSAEDIQLYYQIGLIGRRDLPLAPDGRSGLEMVLLRMLAFRPVAEPADGEVVKPTTHTRSEVTNKPYPASVATPLTTQTREPLPAEKPPVSARTTPQDPWSKLISELPLSGLVRELAQHSALESQQGDRLQLILNAGCAHLLNKEREAMLKKALEDYYGRQLNLHIKVGSPSAETPAMAKTRVLNEQQQEALAAISNDPNVRALQETFNARVNPGSIRPKL